MPPIERGKLRSAEHRCRRMSWSLQSAKDCRPVVSGQMVGFGDGRHQPSDAESGPGRVCPAKGKASMPSNEVDLLDLQFDRLSHLTGSEFILELGPWLESLSSDPVLNPLLEAMAKEAIDIADAFLKHDDELIPKVVELRKTLATRAPGADDSRGPSDRQTAIPETPTGAALPCSIGSPRSPPKRGIGDSLRPGLKIRRELRSCSQSSGASWIGCGTSERLHLVPSRIRRKTCDRTSTISPLPCRTSRRSTSTSGGACWPRSSLRQACPFFTSRALLQT